MEEKKELLDQDKRVVEIELERLRGFVNHPFKVQADSQMIELQESIKKYGILNPLIVRPRQDGTYEIISGHRRKFAAEKIGYRKVPVIIRVLKDDTGTSISTQIDEKAENKMDYIYKNSNWVVFVDPKVDLDFFSEKEAKSDLLIIL